MKNIDKHIDDVVIWLRDKVKAANAKGVVFGLSGGIDSAVVAGISKLAFPEKSLGIIMPCNSNEKDEEHGRLVGNFLGLNTKKVDLSNTYEIFLSSIDREKENLLALNNIKPRLRMTTLYYYAQINNYLVLGCSNKSELYTGYFTKYGDSGSDLIPLGDFLKEEVYEIARHFKIPMEIINKKPSAGLWENQTDEEEMGFSYEVLDKYIMTNKADDESAEKIRYLNKTSEHKRKFPPIYVKKHF